MYNPIIPLIGNILQKQSKAQMIDLGSGGGGGLIRLNEDLRSLHPDLKIILTDLYPNFSAFEYTKKQAGNFEYYPNPVDARNVPEDLKGLRMQFLSFHHFKPKDAIQILQNAVNSGESITIFEAQERSIPSVLAMIFSPITVLLTTPFIRPFKWGRILFTYLIPIIPLFVLWDGVVSAFRTYSVDEMNQLISQVKNYETYNWEVNKIKSGPGVILYLIGTKK